MSHDWRALRADLDRQGWARLPRLLSVSDCRDLKAQFDDDDCFRSTIDMSPRSYGSGVYRYFAEPMPAVVASLRRQLYPPLAVAARAWAERLDADPDAFPGTFAAFRRRCHAAGQLRPTPLLLRYRAGDWNALHQDRYGEIYFPFQVLVPLSRRGADYEGGEVALVEQRPRAQSRATAITVERGDGLVFTSQQRPVRGKRGWHRVAVRHGVSTVTSGERVTLGIIFHDAE